MGERPDWDTYFMGIADAVSARATCDRGKCGTVIVKGKRILTTGYVGAPAGLPHCDEVGHLMRSVHYHSDGATSQHCVRTTHAEQNALIQAARYGIAVDGGIMYTKMAPCLECEKMIINAGITRIVIGKRYHGDKITMEMFRDVGIEVDVRDDTMMDYPAQ